MACKMQFLPASSPRAVVSMFGEQDERVWQMTSPSTKVTQILPAVHKGDIICCCQQHTTQQVFHLASICGLAKNFASFSSLGFIAYYPSRVDIGQAEGECQSSSSSDSYKCLAGCLLGSSLGGGGVTCFWLGHLKQNIVIARAKTVLLLPIITPNPSRLLSLCPVYTSGCTVYLINCHLSPPCLCKPNYLLNLGYYVRSSQVSSSFDHMRSLPAGI